MRPSRALLGALLIATVGLLTGCEPSCEQTCEKLLACDGVDSPRVSEQQCEASCIDQEDLYNTWDDVELQKAFAAHKRCIDQEECGAIAEGVCYDERLYAFPGESETEE